MKTLIILFILGLSVEKVDCQEFSGFGDIRLGVLEEEFLQRMKNDIEGKVVAATEKNIQKMQMEWISYIGSAGDKEPTRLYKLTSKYDIMSWPMSPYSMITQKLSQYPDSFTVYFLPKFSVGQIKLKNIFLVFYRSRLQLIEMDGNNDLSSAAAEKYPPTKIVDTSYHVTCTYVVSGVKTNEPAIRKIYTWANAANDVESFTVMDYTSECKLTFISYIRFITKDLQSSYNSLQKKERDKKDDEKDSKKKSIKDKI